jgi:hypothetical protein
VLFLIGVVATSLAFSGILLASVAFMPWVFLLATVLCGIVAASLLYTTWKRTKDYKEVDVVDDGRKESEEIKETGSNEEVEIEKSKEMVVADEK